MQNPIFSKPRNRKPDSDREKFRTEKIKKSTSRKKDEGRNEINRTRLTNLWIWIRRSRNEISLQLTKHQTGFIPHWSVHLALLLTTNWCEERGLEICSSLQHWIQITYSKKIQNRWWRAYLWPRRPRRERSQISNDLWQLQLVTLTVYCSTTIWYHLLWKFYSFILVFKQISISIHANLLVKKMKYNRLTQLVCCFFYMTLIVIRKLGHQMELTVLSISTTS